MSVEEINPNTYSRDYYFTSSVNVPTRGRQRTATQDNGPRKRLAPGSYNLASIESTVHGTALTEDLAEEKNSNKRFAELDRENYNETARIDLPKLGITFDYPRFPRQTPKNPKTKSKQSSLQQVRKTLASRRGLANYLDEDERNAAILHNVVSKKKNIMLMVPNKKLCSICGDNAPGSCVRCNSRVCSVKCTTVHNETRCTGYFG
ncbi:CYFA0S01e09736g1_1 [Cyberlindnera fabianii]|uniref:CYFA0S01e09736g1_1 n=1 Tax=Cyberlindnera fabianii TaxID=36022 RepID=A0A061AJL9_CYBFA|nr:Vacuolar protein sorting-associated protein 71 [Cyberlindnera fabianii]CDR37336.1 CYFA0S01e09736g1_1 [Cyberlindnera fabianii]